MEKIDYVLPSEIEKRSFQIIESELKKKNIFLPEDEKNVTMRAIHASADFDYAKTLCFSKDAVKIAENLLKKGAHIVTDTNMALAGINKKILAEFGGEAHCFMADEDVLLDAKKNQITRAASSMKKAAQLNVPLIFAIGNAPTALIELNEMIEKKIFFPDFIIALPVGFVNVVAAKELILKTNVPFIVNRGRKGGSNIAAAVCNAILYGLKKSSAEKN